MFKDLIGIPFEFGKTDCWWLAGEVFKRYNINIPEYSISRRAIEYFNLEQTAEEIHKHIPEWTEIKTPEIPCIILMSLGVPDFFNHIGVYIGNDKFIHTTRARGNSTIEKITNPLYANRKIKYYRYDSPDGN